MGRYMTVILKEQYRTDTFQEELNQTLFDAFGANNGVKFKTRKFLQEEADYMNTDPEGLAQVPHFQRPITVETLSNFFWMRTGEFHFKLSCPESAREARDAVAICKWIIKTRGKFIDKRWSSNYDAATLKQYLNHLFIEEGYDLEQLWKV